MKKITAAAAVIIAMLALCACSDKTDTLQNDTALTGTWQEEYYESGYIFNDDGTGTDTFWNLDFTYTAKDGTLVVTYNEEMWGECTYSYTVNGSTLTMTRAEDDAETFTYYKADNISDTAETANTAETNAEST